MIREYQGAGAGEVGGGGGGEARALQRTYATGIIMAGLKPRQFFSPLYHPAEKNALLSCSLFP